MTNIEKTHDHRGFSIYGEFIDTYGNTIIVKKSSSAGVDRVWLFTENNPEFLKIPGSAHLDKSQVLKLIKFLEAAAEEMIFDDEWEESDE